MSGPTPGRGVGPRRADPNAFPAPAPGLSHTEPRRSRLAWRSSALRTAFHEAGHAAAVVLLAGGSQLESVTIRPGQTFGGLTTYWSPLTASDRHLLVDGDGDVARNESLRTRGLAELEAMIILAGRAAQDLWERQERCVELVHEAQHASRATIRRATPVDENAFEQNLAAADHTGLQQAAASGQSVHDACGDEAKAWDLIAAMNPPDPQTMDTHLTYLRARTRTLLQQEWPAVVAIAGALLEHEALSGDAAALLLGAHRS